MRGGQKVPPPAQSVYQALCVSAIQQKSTKRRLLRALVTAVCSAMPSVCLKELCLLARWDDASPPFHRIFQLLIDGRERPLLGYLTGVADAIYSRQRVRKVCERRRLLARFTPLRSLSRTGGLPNKRTSERGKSARAPAQFVVQAARDVTNLAVQRLCFHHSFGHAVVPEQPRP